MFKKTDKKIVYKTENGVMTYSYEEVVKVRSRYHSQEGYIYKIEGTVPADVVAKGEEAVSTYTNALIRREIAKQKKQQAQLNAFLSNPNYPVEVEYNTILLKGKIISAESSTLVVQLDEPYSGRSSVTFGIASALMGRYILDENNQFSSAAIQAAQKLLIQIYKKQKEVR